MTKLHSLIISAAMGLVFCPALVLGQDRNPLLKQAVDALNKGDFNNAIAMCNKAISLNPKDSPAYFYRGSAYAYRAESNRTIADYGKAIADCNQVIQLDPKNPIAYNHRGIIYAKKGDQKKAIADFTEALLLNPKFYPAYDNRGNVYSDERNYGKALADYDEAIRLNPRDFASYNDRGMLYTSKRDYGNALRDFNQALRLDPKNPTVYYNRGCVYDHKGAYDNAIADNSEAIRLNPRTAAERRSRITAYSNRGIAYYHKGEYEKAIADYSDAMRLDPKRWSAYNGLAWIRATAPRPVLRDGRKAVMYATKACELSEWKSWTNIDTLAAAYAETGNFAAAIKWEQRSLQTTNLAQEDAAKAKTRRALYQASKPYHEEKPQPARREEERF
jgi:tetratricopeptide (TPR) repeat protein